MSVKKFVASWADPPGIAKSSALVVRADDFDRLALYAQHHSSCAKMSQMPMVNGQVYMSSDWHTWRAAQVCNCGLLKALVETTP